MTNFEYLLSIKKQDFDMLVMLLSDLIYDESTHEYSEDESSLTFVEDWLNRGY